MKAFNFLVITLTVAGFAFAQEGVVKPNPNRPKVAPAPKAAPKVEAAHEGAAPAAAKRPEAIEPLVQLPKIGDEANGIDDASILVCRQHDVNNMIVIDLKASDKLNVFTQHNDMNLSQESAEKDMLMTNVEENLTKYELSIGSRKFSIETNDHKSAQLVVEKSEGDATSSELFECKFHQTFVAKKAEVKVEAAPAPELKADVKMGVSNWATKHINSFRAGIESKGRDAQDFLRQVSQNLETLRLMNAPLPKVDATPVAPAPEEASPADPDPQD